MRAGVASSSSIRTNPLSPVFVSTRAIALLAVGGKAKPVRTNGPRSAALWRNEATTAGAGISRARKRGEKRALRSAARRWAARPLSCASAQASCRPTAVAGIAVGGGGGVPGGGGGGGADRVAGGDAPIGADLGQRQAGALGLGEPGGRGGAVD